MVHSRLHLIPLILVVYFPASFLICYFVALHMGHIDPYYAFISDAGTLPPEQHLFSQFVNMGAALFAYFVYIRYIQVDSYMRIRYNQSTPIANVIAIAFGFISALGMSLVGNFPELSQKETHLLGAFLAFVGGSIYAVFQGYFTFKLLACFQSRSIAYVRTFLGILGIMCYFGAQATVILAFQRITNKEKLENNAKSLKWDWSEGGYKFRAASVIMEWLLLIIFDIFIATFVVEFRKFKMEAPHVKFLIDVVNPVDEDSVDGAIELESNQRDKDTLRSEVDSKNSTYIHLTESIVTYPAPLILDSSTGSSRNSTHIIALPKNLQVKFTGNTKL